uniref:FYVE, RhoGEF and PH domain containing 6 n=1 Tax=Anabas testudineus TaxID=64144 RepID=A0A7N6AJC5_ANATE
MRMHKPPLAPKPKLVQSPGRSPATPRSDGLTLPSPGTQRRAKPALAPKPCLSKLTSAVESKAAASNSLHQTTVTEHPRTVGLLNTQNGIQQENKKPDWDYVIPICLCTQQNCTCITNTSPHKDKVEKDSKTCYRGKTEESRKLLPTSRVDNSDKRTDNAKSQVSSNDPPQTVCLTASSKSHHSNHKHIPHRTLSDEANGNVIPQSAPGQGLEGNPPGSEQISRASQPKSAPAAPRKPFPVPVPRKPRAAVLAHQEKVEDKKEESVSHRGRKVSAGEVNVSLEGKSSSSLSVSKSVNENKQPIVVSSTKACTPPAPPPKKKPFLSAPEKAPTSGSKTILKDVKKEELGWDSSIYEMEVSVDKEDEEVEREERDHQEAVYYNVTHYPPSSSLLTQPELSQPPAITVAAEENRALVKVAPKKPQRTSSPMARTHVPHLQDRVLKKAVLGELPLPPDGKTQSNRPTARVNRSSQSSLSKQKAKSFSGADIIRSERQRKNSFRKLLDLKLSVKNIVKGGQSAETTANNDKQSVDKDPVEQSVDDDEFSPGAEEAVYYENISCYEDIPDYMNVQAIKAVSSPQVSASQHTAWHSEMYYDEGIYEEQQPYISVKKNTEHQQYQSQTDLCQTQNGQKKSKIQHIATEVMTSERDFRNAVSNASHQSGKPVIEERILNQILYYLPQLYELNQDLLKELQQRVAKWDENAQLADIFLKKGPYLKMYSTYIREFDKNVTLLEEQSKRNPAFGAVVQEFEANPRCANLALKHYLLKPVQRIPQYQLLLTDYLKNLPKDSIDYKDTQAALALVKDVANHANDIMKQGDNFQKLIQVQCSLNGHHELVQPGRIYLKEGVLMKLSRKIMQPRMFFLFNDVLLYTTPVQSGQYKLNNMLSLAGMKVSKPSQEAYQNELTLESVERSFILSASSATERDEWLEAISTAISDFTRKKISFISGKPPEEEDDGAPLGSKAPVWIPDPRTTMCMICTCEFSLTWRRHHCRACGKVVCQSCSSSKHRLEYLKNELARVCDQCFIVLVQQKSKTVPGNKAGFAKSRRNKKIPAALKEVSANTHNSSMSGYLQRSKGNKKQGKRLWFVIKDKVLYTYAASEDVAALESQPLLGFMLKPDSSDKSKFKLYHKNTLYYNFKADDVQTAQRWINSFKEATVL